MRIIVGSQVCAVIMHELVLIFNKSQKGKEYIKQKENMANLAECRYWITIPLFPSENDWCDVDSARLL